VPVLAAEKMASEMVLLAIKREVTSVTVKGDS
jgi:hypothetical protein